MRFLEGKEKDMSRVSSEADSTEFVPPSLKKAKTDPEAEVEGEEAEAEVARILRIGEWDDPEYTKQRLMFEEQFKKSEGYDVEWDKLDFLFPVLQVENACRLDEELNNKELVEMLIETAIAEENEDNDTKTELVKYVSANVMGVQGFLFFITFWGKDVSLPNPEPKLYQAKVRKFAEEILVRDFRLKPTQEGGTPLI